MAHTCRGTINLATAHIDTEDACNIVLSSGGRTYHLKASTEVERQRWVTALELAKAKAIRMMNDQSGKGSCMYGKFKLHDVPFIVQVKAALKSVMHPRGAGARRQWSESESDLDK